MGMGESVQIPALNSQPKRAIAPRNVPAAVSRRACVLPELSVGVRSVSMPEWTVSTAWMLRSDPFSPHIARVPASAAPETGQSLAASGLPPIAYPCFDACLIGSQHVVA